MFRVEGWSSPRVDFLHNMSDATASNFGKLKPMIYIHNAHIGYRLYVPINLISYLLININCENI